MLIIEVMGGLGNQLQQYALCQKLKSLGKEAKLDVSWFTDEKKQKEVLASRRLELTSFVDLPMDICTEKEKERLLGKDNLSGKLVRKLFPDRSRRFTESRIYHPEIFGFEDQYLSGFWACEKYYADILPKLRKLIIFPNMCEFQKCETITNESRYSHTDESASAKPANNLSGLSDRERIKCLNCRTIMKMTDEYSVSIHVRRGDYLDLENAALFGGICTEEYYAASVEYVKRRYPRAHFYVFSDDIPYVRKLYQGPRYTIVDWNTGADSFRDIQLMSCCKHNICANSTFSFWGARLNPNQDKIMIRPAKHKNGQPVNSKQLHELWEQWTIMDENGRLV